MADGLGGGISTSVGVGTGGNIRVGGGLGGVVPAGALVPDADVAADTGGALTGAWLGTVGDASGRGGREAYPTAVTGSEVATSACGASPIPPAPVGAAAVGRVGGGVPSSQPIVSATGSPNATMPKKTHLGESRTQEQRREEAKGYAFKKVEILVRSSRRLSQSTAGRS